MKTEREVLNKVIAALEPLDQDERARAVIAVCAMLNIQPERTIESDHLRLTSRTPRE